MASAGLNLPTAVVIAPSDRHRGHHHDDNDEDEDEGEDDRKDRLTFYISNCANFNKTYGSLGAIAALMFWFYVSAFVVLLGAELNAEMELQTARDTTTGPPRPMGERGAYVADHVA